MSDSRTALPAAGRWFAEAVRQAPSSPFAYTEWGQTLLGKGVVDGAIAKLTLAHAKGPRFADPLELWKAMRLGLVGKGSPMDMLVKQFLPGVYEPPAFALKLAHKDVRLATELARELGVPMRLANLTLEEMTEALGRGFGDQDSRAYLQLQLERAGVEIAVDPEALRLAVEQARS